MMSITRRKELDSQIRDRKMPEVTRESVADLARSLRDNMAPMLREAVVEVHDWLRPQRSKLKTNSKLEVRQKVILERTVELKWVGKGWNVDPYYGSRMTALENVFSALDGRGQVHRSHYSDLESAIRETADGRGRTRYFEFVCHRNGNLHLRFLCPDLLKRFNEIAGGRRLRPAA